MIKAFNRIRKNLINKGNLQKYLIYAFGEILLIVAGIWIALQINTWSQHNKDRRLEIDILEEIQVNISADFVNHTQNMYVLNHTVNSSEIILEHLNTGLPYHDSLAYHFAWLPMGANFDAIRSGYELMLSKGVNIITNDTVRMKISHLYENRYSWIRDFLKDNQNINSQIVLTEMMSKFKTLKVAQSSVPRNYDDLTVDDDFKIKVDQNGYMNQVTRDFYQQLIINDANALLDDLNAEIQRLRNRH